MSDGRRDHAAGVLRRHGYAVADETDVAEAPDIERARQSVIDSFMRERVTPDGDDVPKERRRSALT